MDRVQNSNPLLVQFARHLGAVSISRKMSYRKISQIIDAASVYICLIALKFDRCLGSTAAETPVKFQGNMIT